MKHPVVIQGWKITVQNGGMPSVGCVVNATAWGYHPDYVVEKREQKVCDIIIDTPHTTEATLKFLAEAIDRMEAKKQIDLARWKEGGHR
jgi:hypothetical protein